MEISIIQNRIYEVRGHKVMLDYDLAELYEVETKRLNEQVKRNPERFPKDFMFQLSEEEYENLRSQIATSSLWGGRRTFPYAFTEHGVLMLSSVLNSKRAIDMNIRIMRVYVKIREMLNTNSELAGKMTELDSRISGQDEKITRLFTYVQQLAEKPQQKQRARVGYKAGEG